MQILTATNFPLGTVFIASRKFWYVVFSFFSRYFKISFIFSFLTHTLKVFGLLPHVGGFPTFLASIDFKFHSIVTGKDTLYGLNPYKFVKIFLCVWHKMWSVLDNILYSLEKTVYSAFVGWSVISFLFACVCRSHFGFHNPCPLLTIRLGHVSSEFSDTETNHSGGLCTGYIFANSTCSVPCCSWIGTRDQPTLLSPNCVMLCQRGGGTRATKNNKTSYHLNVVFDWAFSWLL